jgi:hypothetical protein
MRAVVREAAACQRDALRRVAFAVALLAGENAMLDMQWILSLFFSSKIQAGSDSREDYKWTHPSSRFIASLGAGIPSWRNCKARFPHSAS